MTTTGRISIELDDARRVFDFLEKVHDLMHQPSQFRDSAQVEKFVSENYEEAKDLYYHTVWNWLPDEVKREIEDR